MTSANIVFGDRFASVVPLINIANTGGVAAGPPLGGFLYELFGYSGPFFLIGGCVLFYGAVITPCLGFQFETMIEAGHDVVDDSERSITCKDFLKNGVSLSHSANSDFTDRDLHRDAAYYFLRAHSGWTAGAQIWLYN